MDFNKWIRERWLSKLHDWLLGCPLSLDLILFYITFLTLALLFAFFTNTTIKY